MVEVQQQLVSPFDLDQEEELISDVLDCLVADEPGIDEVDDGDIACRRKSKLRAGGTGHRPSPVANQATEPLFPTGRQRSTCVVRFGTGSELVEGNLLLGVNLEDLVQPGDPKHFEEIGVDAAELQLTLDGPDLFLQVDELAQGGA